MTDRLLEAMRDFDHCYDIEADTTKWCKDCSKRQRQLCEAEVNLTDNKPIKENAK